ncbi:hypothetical protein Tco_0087484 [Tanacetum coccineum]
MDETGDFIRKPKHQQSSRSDQSFLYFKSSLVQSCTLSLKGDEWSVSGRDVVIVVASVLIGGGVTSDDGLIDETSVKEKIIEE